MFAGGICTIPPAQACHSWESKHFSTSLRLSFESINVIILSKINESNTQKACMMKESPPPETESRNFKFPRIITFASFKFQKASIFPNFRASSSIPRIQKSIKSLTLVKTNQFKFLFSSLPQLPVIVKIELLPPFVL